MMVFSLSNSNVKQTVSFIKERKIEIIYGLFLCLGLILGAVFSGKQTLDGLDLSVFFNNFLLSHRNGSFLNVFLNALSSGFLYILFCFFSGMFALGGLSNALIILFKGSSVGLLMGYSYLFYGLKGLAFAFIIILPGAFVACIAFILSCKESFLFSLNFFRLFTKQPTLKSVVQDFKLYCIKFVIYLILIILSALLDGILTYAFWGVFGL